MRSKFRNFTSLLPTLTALVVLLLATGVCANLIRGFRVFSHGENLWSKSEKQLQIDLLRFSYNRDPLLLADATKNLEVLEGDRIARVQLDSPNPNYQIVFDGFVQGGNAPDDIPSAIRDYRLFGHTQSLSRALKAWRDADSGVDDLKICLSELTALGAGDSSNQAASTIGNRLMSIDMELTERQRIFSETMNAESNRAESIVLISNAVTGAFFFIVAGIVSRRLNRRLLSAELRDLALRKANDELETRVLQRTAELETEVLERRQAEEELQWKTAFLEAQGDATEDGILVVDGKGDKVFRNKRFLQLWNIPTAIAVAKSDAEQVEYVLALTKQPDKFLERVNYLYAHPTETGRDEIELKDGTVLDRYSSPVLGKNGENYGRIWAFRDITERKRVERQLRESEELFREVFAHAPFGMYVCGLDGRFIQVNNALRRMMGYESHELRGIAWATLVHPDDLEASLNRMWQLLKGVGGCLEAEHRCIQRGGQVVWDRVRVSLVRDSSGSPLHFVAHVEDITERRKAEQELCDSEERFRAVVEAAPLGMYIETEGIFRYLNPSAVSMFGAQCAEQIIGRSYLDLVHPDSRAAVIERAQAVKQERRAAPLLEERHLRLNGSTFDTENSAVPFKFDGREGAIIFFRDLTERKQKDEALLLSEATQRSLVQNAPYGILRSTPEGKILSGNPAICNMLGYSSEDELRSVNLPQIMYHNAWERSVLVEILHKDGVLHNIETAWRCKDGRSITVQINCHACTDVTGDVVFESFIEDITERKRSERELGRLNRAMSTLSRCNEALVHATEESELLHQICEIVVRVGGYSLAWVGYTNSGDKAVRLMAKAGLDNGFIENAQVTWDDNSRGCGATGTAIKTGEPCVLRDVLNNPKFAPWREAAARHGFASDISLPLNDEKLRIGALTIYAQEQDAFDDREVELLKELAANLAYGIAALRSEAERRQAEEAVHRSEERFQQLAENFRGVIWVIPQIPDEKPYISPAYEKVWGRTCNSYYQNPTSWVESVHPDDMEQALLMFAPQVEGKAAEAEFRVLTADGQEKWIRDLAFPVFDSAGHLIRVVGIAEEITERKHYEAELIRSRKDAEAANRAKSEFLANMSHEIRTPMNGVLGMTELALGSQPEPAQREYLETIKSSADALLTVINDILDFSKIEAGKMDIEAADFNLRQCMEDALRPLAVSANRKGLKFLCDIAPDVLEIVHGDSARLRQVILNLVGNAVKFTAAGKVAVRVRMKDVNHDFANLRFTVSDTGIGISPEKRKTIFDPFEQADSSTTRKYGGTGLGLTISARLISMMGGRIWVDSEEGHGSQFHFTVQMKISQGIAEQMITLPVETKAVVVSSLRILLAEDNRVNQVVARRMLENLGHTVEIAKDGNEVVSMLANDAFDLVMMDVQMPEMDGFVATGKIRESEKQSGSHIPIIAMTAHAMVGDRERCLGAGMDGYISKPVTGPDLEKAISSVFSTRAAVSSPSRASHAFVHSNIVDEHLLGKRAGGIWISGKTAADSEI